MTNPEKNYEQIDPEKRSKKGREKRDKGPERTLAASPREHTIQQDREQTNRKKTCW